MKEPEQKSDTVWFPGHWTWKQIFDWLQKQNRDVSWWGQSTDGRPECHLKPING